MIKFNNRSYSDKKLESLSSKPDYVGKAVWMSHKSEIYGFGKTFRQKFNYSKYMPLCISSDHAVNYYSHIRPSEKNISLPYFTWNKKKFIKMKKKGYQVYLVEHPWINYRKKFFTRNKKAKGTLFFFHHSTSSGTTIKYSNLSSLIQKLKRLPKKCQPVSICLFHYDIRELKVHKVLRKYNVNIVTVGHGNSQNFHKKFYELVNHFKYTCANIYEPDLSSSFFYTLDAGIPTFLFKHKSQKIGDGTNPEYIKRFSTKVLDKFELKKFSKIYKRFSKIRDKVSVEDKKIINFYIGRDCDDNSFFNKIKIQFILYKSLLLNIKLVFHKYYYGVIKKKLNI